MKRSTIGALVGMGLLASATAIGNADGRLRGVGERLATLEGLARADADRLTVLELAARTETPQQRPAMPAPVSESRLQDLQAEMIGLLEERLTALEARLDATSQGVQEASFLREELELARQDAAALRDQVSRDVGRTQKLVDLYRDDLHRHGVRVRRATENTQAELARLTGRVRPDAAELTRDLLSPTVQLNGQETVGSGTLVRSDRDPRTGAARNYVLTAYHVVRNILNDTPNARAEGIPVTVYTPEGRVEVRAELVSSERALDVALLELDTDRTFDQVAKVLPREASDAVRVWDDVYAIGCPLGNDPIPTQGTVSSTENLIQGTNYWMISAPTYYGNSGGGIFLADGRRLLGVFSKIYTHGRGNPVVVPHMGLCTPMSAIYAWLDAEGYGDVIPQVPLAADAADLSSPGR
ncbi:MAG: trypsin-like peptidase domain-containing protein [Planctomycetota bacterium]|nr:trypsin-like peptidase domain-containing protein [Planctomycetota bacterium]